MGQIGMMDMEVLHITSSLLLVQDRSPRSCTCGTLPRRGESYLVAVLHMAAADTQLLTWLPAGGQGSGFPVELALLS